MSIEPLVSIEYGLGSPRPNRPSPVGWAGTVLLALADALEREQLDKALTIHGCKTLLALDGKVALETAKSGQPNLIVLDTSLPGSDGFQICGALRDEELLTHIPVMLLSHGFGAQEKMRGLGLGAVDYITEPFDWAEVAEKISSHLKLERVRSELKLANFDLMTKQAQLQADLKAAAGIQKSLLPKCATEKFEDISVSWRFLPLDQVGGDLLGYAWLDEDHLAAYVIDVCGHGLPAAMMTAAISVSLATVETDEGRGSAKQRSAFFPKQVLEALDREYPLERFERPFTISYLVLNRKTGEFRCSRAGHPMPIIVRRGGQLELVEAGGTIIGLGDMLPFDEAVGRLNCGDSILLYSDGVTECANESGIFGIEGLSQVLQQCSESSPERVCEWILDELRQFNGDAALGDDVTMLMLAYAGTSQPIEEEIKSHFASGHSSLLNGGN